MKKKITKKENFSALLEVVKAIECDRKDELITFINHEIDLLTRKASSGKLTKTQKENLQIKKEIIKVLCESDKGEISIKELSETENLNFSNQKLSSLLTQLVNAEEIERIKTKEGVKFKLK